jgi:hypothetical protein
LYEVSAPTIASRIIEDLEMSPHVVLNFVRRLQENTQERTAWRLNWQALPPSVNGLWSPYVHYRDGVKQMPSAKQSFAELLDQCWLASQQYGPNSIEIDDPSKLKGAPGNLMYFLKTVYPEGRLLVFHSAPPAIAPPLFPETREPLQQSVTVCVRITNQ